MPHPKTSARLAGASVLLFAVGLSLTGCAPAPTGRSISATERQIESIPGVENATVDATANLDGFTTYQSVDITVEVSDGYQVGDADAAIVWLAREAWSVGPRRPDSMGIYLEDSSGKPFNWGWKAALAKHGLDKPVIENVMPRLLPLAGTYMTSLTGKKWPGPMPKTPANLFVKG